MIYLIKIKNTNYIKIGYSSNPYARFKAYLTYVPNAAIDYFIFKYGSKNDETEHHIRLKEYRLEDSDEWFEPPSDVIDDLYHEFEFGEFLNKNIVRKKPCKEIKDMFPKRHSDYDGYALFKKPRRHKKNFKVKDHHELPLMERLVYFVLCMYSTCDISDARIDDIKYYTRIRSESKIKYLINRLVDKGIVTVVNFMNKTEYVLDIEDDDFCISSSIMDENIHIISKILLISILPFWKPYYETGIICKKWDNSIFRLLDSGYGDALKSKGFLTYDNQDEMLFFNINEKLTKANYSNKRIVKKYYMCY